MKSAPAPCRWYCCNTSAATWRTGTLNSSTLASERRVVALDNAGVGATTGTTPSTIEQMARDAIAFIAALDAPRVDILGFSIGSFVAQEIALIRPDVLRRLVLASSAPRGGAGMHGWAPAVINAVGQPRPDPAGYLDVFFTSSPASRHALPPLFIQIGDKEILYDDATRIRDRALAAGVQVTFESWEHGIHVWPVYIASGLAESALAMEHLAACLKAGSPAASTHRPATRL